MTDEQLKRKNTIKRILLGSFILLLLSCGIWYFRYSTEAEYQSYLSQVAQEASAQQQVSSLTSANNELLTTIEENGKELVSFSEDKIKYINLASELSLKYNVVINKLTVSDVWNEGEMSGMTTSIEIQGTLDDVESFVEDYCSTKYTNRVNVVSMRPLGRYVWLGRAIDDEKVLTWFDLSQDETLWEEKVRSDAAQALQQQVADNFGLPVVNTTVTSTLPYTYDPDTGKFIYNGTSVEVDQDTLDLSPISLDKMFSAVDMKAYLVIDFLGRS